jgi:hypothetical protein
MQDLADSCSREEEEDSEGHVLWDTTSLSLGGLAGLSASLLSMVLPERMSIALFDNALGP